MNRGCHTCSTPVLAVPLFSCPLSLCLERRAHSCAPHPRAPPTAIIMVVAGETPPAPVLPCLGGKLTIMVRVAGGLNDAPGLR